MTRWSVKHGSYGAWRVYRGGALVSVFSEWRRAYEYARQQALFDGLGIIGLEVTA